MSLEAIHEPDAAQCRLGGRSHRRLPRHPHKHVAENGREQWRLSGRFMDWSSAIATAITVVRVNLKRCQPMAIAGAWRSSGSIKDILARYRWMD